MIVLLVGTMKTFFVRYDFAFVKAMFTQERSTIVKNSIHRDINRTVSWKLAS